MEAEIEIHDDGSIDISLPEGSEEELKDGEELTALIEEDGNWRDELVIYWQTTGDLGSSGVAEEIEDTLFGGGE